MAGVHLLHVMFSFKLFIIRYLAPKGMLSYEDGWCIGGSEAIVAPRRYIGRPAILSQTSRGAAGGGGGAGGLGGGGAGGLGGGAAAGGGRRGGAGNILADLLSISTQQRSRSRSRRRRKTRRSRRSRGRRSRRYIGRPAILSQTNRGVGAGAGGKGRGGGAGGAG